MQGSQVDHVESEREKKRVSLMDINYSGLPVVVGLRAIPSLVSKMAWSLHPWSSPLTWRILDLCLVNCRMSQEGEEEEGKKKASLLFFPWPEPNLSCAFIHTSGGRILVSEWVSECVLSQRAIVVVVVLKNTRPAGQTTRGKQLPHRKLYYGY